MPACVQPRLGRPVAPLLLDPPSAGRHRLLVADPGPQTAPVEVQGHVPDVEAPLGQEIQRFRAPARRTGVIGRRRTLGAQSTSSAASSPSAARSATA
ncbi:hypothetical protein [Embleya sp. NPDC020886]|uniref:hypothetical protein n=1 Tax=Embleya sp. NPDC020886 TaxID=3363980 RepID=UPI0037B96978